MTRDYHRPGDPRCTCGLCVMARWESHQRGVEAVRRRALQVVGDTIRRHDPAAQRK